MNPRSPRLSPLLWLLTVAVACGDSGATSGDTQTTSAGTATTTTTGDATTTTGEPTTGATEATTTGSTTAATTTSSSSSTSTSTTTGTTTTTGESTTEASTGTTTTGGSMEELPCVDDADCTILDDCCACDPHHVDQEVATCDEDCDQSACAAAGLAQAKAICRVGRCTFEKVTCNPLYVACKSLPPECPPGSVPGVDGECWSGACVPGEACDWAPDCSACAAPGLTCVGHLQKGSYVLCEPLPLACGDGPATCECAGVICDASPPWSICHDAGQGIHCECPVC